MQWRFKSNQSETASVYVKFVKTTSWHFPFNIYAHTTEHLLSHILWLLCTIRGFFLLNFGCNYTPNTLGSSIAKIWVVYIKRLKGNWSAKPCWGSSIYMHHHISFANKLRPQEKHANLSAQTFEIRAFFAQSAQNSNRIFIKCFVAAHSAWFIHALSKVNASPTRITQSQEVEA